LGLYFLFITQNLFPYFLPVMLDPFSAREARPENARDETFARFPPLRAVEPAQWI
jgi:hypothetical protein